ncbi:uncharacterized protein LOC132385589 isoform X2 [Hypanus sabinus]|uniref:uncharacterized protein LOC132385589 isoform X2 n=1 Tax=Hypanus sabinus TaxID=79690 RepID=UPI0028C38ECD|nr:uncharacterized protein LOC132385589 isoform X2 [Hypanus sabinus]
MEAPVKIKRTAITLAQKVQIILKLNNPSFKQKEIAQEYGLTASAISKIVKKKEGILEEWLRGGNLERKRKREGKNQTVDDALLSWFWLASREEGPISGPVLMAKAKALAEEMGVEFKPTNGWLCRWKNRNNLAYRRAPRDRGEGRTAGDHRTGGAHFPSTPGLPRGQWRAAVAGSSDSSSDEIPAAGPAGQPTVDTQHRPKWVKKEELPPQSGPSCPSYTDQREFVSDTSDTSSDEASVKQDPTSQAAAQVKHEEPFCGGEQTHTQALQQLGSQRPLRGLYELPEEPSHDRCRGQMWDDSTFEDRNQSCKGEKSCRKDPPLCSAVPAGYTDKSEQAATIALLRNAYFAAKEMIPSSSAGALNELCLLQGLGDPAGQLSARQRCRPIEEFQRAIADALEQGILERARALNCFGVLIDLPRDRRAFLYLRVLERAGAAREPRTYLLSVEELRGEATAREVAAVLIRVLAQKGLDSRRMCGLALDGTAVSAECREGVEAELRARVPGLLCVRCLAHRLTLSWASAADTIPYLVKYREILRSIYTHLAELPRSRDGPEAVGEVLAHREEPGGDGSPSEWLAARAPVDAVLRDFGRLVCLLRDGGSARGAWLAKALCSYKFLHCSHLLADVLHQLSILGRSCQRPDPDFSIVHPLLRSTVTTISKPSAGEALKHFLAALPPHGPFTFQGQAIRDGPRQRREAEGICTAFLENLTRDLRARFSEARDADVVTSMTAVFDPRAPAGLQDPARPHPDRLPVRPGRPGRGGALRDELPAGAGRLPGLRGVPAGRPPPRQRPRRLPAGPRPEAHLPGGGLAGRALPQPAHPHRPAGGPARQGAGAAEQAGPLADHRAARGPAQDRGTRAAHQGVQLQGRLPAAETPGEVTSQPGTGPHWQPLITGQGGGPSPSPRALLLCVHW